MGIQTEKIVRNISKGTMLKVPAHYIPKFKPAREFENEVKTLLKVKESTN